MPQFVKIILFSLQIRTATQYNYDLSGNPTRYYNGYTMTWAEGRRLESVTVGGQTYTYQYNADGQRTKKTNCTVIACITKVSFDNGSARCSWEYYFKDQYGSESGPISWYSFYPDGSNKPYRFWYIYTQ